MRLNDLERLTSYSRHWTCKRDWQTILCDQGSDMTPEEVFETFQRQADEFANIIIIEVGQPSIPWDDLATRPKSGDAVAFAEELCICPDVEQVRTRIRRDHAKALAFYKHEERIRGCDISANVAENVRTAFSTNKDCELNPFCILGLVIKFVLEEREGNHPER